MVYSSMNKAAYPLPDARRGSNVCQEVRFFPPEEKPQRIIYLPTVDTLRKLQQTRFFAPFFTVRNLYFSPVRYTVPIEKLRRLCKEILAGDDPGHVLRRIAQVTGPLNQEQVPTERDS
jgi:hypothetical protein